MNMDKITARELGVEGYEAVNNGDTLIHLHLDRGKGTSEKSMTVMGAKGYISFERSFKIQGEYILVDRLTLTAGIKVDEVKATAVFRRLQDEFEQSLIGSMVERLKIINDYEHQMVSYLSFVKLKTNEYTRKDGTCGKHMLITLQLDPKSGLTKDKLRTTLKYIGEKVSELLNIYSS